MRTIRLFEFLKKRTQVNYVSTINGNSSSEFKLTREESVTLAGMMEAFMKAEKREGLDMER